MLGTCRILPVHLVVGEARYSVRATRIFRILRCLIALQDMGTHPGHVWPDRLVLVRRRWRSFEISGTPPHSVSNKV